METSAPQDDMRNSDMSSFYLAARDGDLETVQSSLEKWPELVHMKWGGNPVIYAAAKEDRVEVVRLLIQSGADINQQCDDGWTALGGALLGTGGHAINETARLLMDSGAQVDWRAAGMLTEIAREAEQKTAPPPPPAPVSGTSKTGGGGWCGVICLSLVASLGAIITVACRIFGA